MSETLAATATWAAAAISARSSSWLRSVLLGGRPRGGVQAFTQIAAVASCQLFVVDSVRTYTIPQASSWVPTRAAWRSH